MIRQFGYTAIKAQALTVPPYIFGIFCVLLGAWYSDRYQKRAKMLLLSYGIGMCGILVVWPCLHFRGTAGASYAALFFVVGAFNAQVSNPSTRFLQHPFSLHLHAVANLYFRSHAFTGSCCWRSRDKLPQSRQTCRW